MWRPGILLLLCGLLLLSSPAYADTQQPPANKGLSVTPSRAYVTADPGKVSNQKIIVANNTEAPLTVTLSVEQFTVADYTYDYRFENVHDDWLKLGATQIDLLPGKSQSIPYAILPPADATPGGHYFTILATAKSGSGQSQVRVASVLYLTVVGDLRVSSSLQSVSIPHLAFGDINFKIQVKNTGNTHFFIYVSGGLHGLAASKDGASTQLLLPQVAREVGGAIAAPLLPGIYTATVGYVTDTGQIVQRSTHVVYIPPWSLLVATGLLWLLIIAARYMRRRTLRDS